MFVSASDIGVAGITAGATVLVGIVVATITAKTTNRRQTKQLAADLQRQERQLAAATLRQQNELATRSAGLARQLADARELSDLTASAHCWMRGE